MAPQVGVKQDARHALERFDGWKVVSLEGKPEPIPLVIGSIVAFRRGYMMIDEPPFPVEVLCQVDVSKDPWHVYYSGMDERGVKRRLDLAGICRIEKGQVIICWRKRTPPDKFEAGEGRVLCVMRAIERSEEDGT